MATGQTTPLGEIAAALAGMDRPGAFATRLGCPGEDLRLEVEGVGPIAFPVTAACARKLCAVARPAAYGRGRDTVTDRRVRDTWVIARSRLRFDTRRWTRALKPRLAKIEERLGLAADGELKAELHDLLVYAPGQFFVPHQDSEKSDDMVGSLLVVLPSTHTGGSVVVAHRGEEMVFRRAARPVRPTTDLSLIAFYSDCRHEVRPVKSGYRIVLTYRLSYGRPRRAAPASRGDAKNIEVLRERVRRYFATPVARSPYSREPPERPDRLIYLLDHEYTQRSLGWDRLKNLDRILVGALGQVAGDLECDAYLVLADVHESWGCEGDDDSGDYGWGRRRGYRTDDDDRDPDDYQLIDLCDTEIELRHWVDSDGKPVAGIGSGAASDEVCTTTPSVDMTPFRSEHEGYMGNWGNTVDRWYHRAAVVLSPRERRFVVRAKLAPSSAVDQVSALLRGSGRDADAARSKTASLLPIWDRSAPLQQGVAFFTKTARLAGLLDDAALATALLRPFGPHRLTPGSAGVFAALVERYGLLWSQELFSSWAEAAGDREPAWLAFLPQLCRTLSASRSDSPRALAQWLVGEELARLRRRAASAIEASAGRRVASRELSALGDEVVALLAGAALVESPAARDEVVAFLTAAETGYPLLALGHLLEGCSRGRGRKALEALGLDPRRVGLDRVYDHVVRELAAVAGSPARDPHDWSIAPPTRCTCALCRELAAFLADSTRVEQRWPLAKNGRRHVHGALDGHDLPVSHVTHRRGSPFTLVLKKLPALFEREAALREQHRTLHASLARQRAAFTMA